MTATKERKPDALDQRYAAQVQVAAPRHQWLAVKKAIEEARDKAAKDDRRYWVIEPFLGKLQAALRDYKAPGLGEPGYGLGMNETNIPVTGTAHGWILVAEWILAFGDEEAKAVGQVIIPAVSQVIFAMQGNKSDE